MDTKIKDLTSRTPAVGDQIPINDISGPDQDGQVTVGACLDLVAGDVNVDASAVSTIPNNTVTYAKIQDVSATDRILGRDTAGAGDIEEISLNSTLEFTGSGAVQRAALSGDVTASAGSNTTAIGSGVIVNDDVNASAAIVTTKLADSANFVLKNTAQTYDDGIKLTFNPNGTNAGINVGSHTADPSSPTDGDLLYNSTTPALRARINGAWVSLGAGGSGGSLTELIPIVMEVPNDTVAYPDVFTLGDATSKISGFWLPNSAASEIVFKCVVPEELHGTPASAVRIYMLPRTTVASSTVNLQIKRLFVNDTEDVDVAFTPETALDVNLTSTADFLTIYDYDLTAEPTAGELFHGILKRDPAAGNDDFTEDLFIVGMYLKIERQTV